MNNYYSDKEALKIINKYLPLIVSPEGVHVHAYLTEGEEELCERLCIYSAAALMCAAQPKPCGVCPSCRKAFSGEHPDIYFYGSSDKAVAMAEIRELISTTVLKPNDTHLKVYIIRGADNLRIDAQNALLKLLEEPPESVVVFLIACSTGSLLPTVVSRIRRVRIEERVPKAGSEDELYSKAKKTLELLKKNKKSDYYEWCISLSGGREEMSEFFDIYLSLLAQPAVGDSQLFSALADVTYECREAMDHNGNTTAAISFFAAQTWSVKERTAK